MTRPSLFGVTFLQVACSFVVIFVTTTSLLGPADRCYLSNKPHELGACYFAVTAGAVSIGTAVLAGCLSCLSCDCCGLGPVCSILLAAFNCIWWLAAAAVLTAATAVADAAGMQAAGPRHALIAAAWTAAVLELVHSILACVAVGNNVCNILFCVPAVQADEECCAGCEECCGGSCSCCCRPNRRRHPLPHHQQPLLPGTAVAAAATAAVLSKRAWWGVVQPQQQQQQQQRPAGAWPHAAAVAGQPPGAAGYMPPPPTAGQPFVYMAPSQQPGLTAGGSAVGVPVAAAAAAPGVPVGSHQMQGGAGPYAAAAPSAPALAAGPYAPPVVLQPGQHQQHHQQQQQQQQHMDAYPKIAKQ
uniref:Uncharacterized protein n=1 Tax=Tetradesmus obliquus TaxID=3088 RepID=A0A383WG79_TETOB|eukprot:jgi/Sobl393_1/16992/SZX76410.1